MEGAKPIEAGWMAIITRCSYYHSYVGAGVGVIRKSLLRDCVSEGDKLSVGNWVIDFKIDAGMLTTISEKYLLRIDDPDIQKQIESESKVKKAQPELVDLLHKLLDS